MLLGSLPVCTRTILIQLQMSNSQTNFCKKKESFTEFTNYLYRTKTVNGNSIKVLNLPSLTARVRAHFNCPTVEGAYLENEDIGGTAVTHLERRVFFSDVNSNLTYSKIG